MHDLPSRRRTTARSILTTLTLLLGALLIVACSRPQPPSGGEAGAGQGAAERGDEAARSAEGGVTYDVDDDPLVNPESTYLPKPSDPSRIATGETLYRNIDGNPSNLNPIFMSSTYEFYLAGVLFNGLFTFDAEMQWMTNPDVVESFEESDDHLVYTVRMKPDLTWQDGHPFTAHDVVFSWKNILDERVPCPAVKTGTDKVVEVTALDDRTVRMVHEAALPTNKWNALFPIIPKHLYEKDKEAHPDLKTGDYYNELNRDGIVGNGPYKLVEWKENDKIVVERWEDYWGTKPAFKRMVFRIIPDNNILLLTFNKGEVDEFRMTPKQFATQTLTGSDFDAAGGIKVYAPKWDFLYIGWNQDGSNPFFGDVKVRRAMTHALDIERIRRDLTYNLYQICYGPYHPDSWMFNPEVKDLRFEFDLDRAEELLDEAGWEIDEDRQGWRYKTVEGQPTRFEFTLLIPQGSSLGTDMAAIYQEDLKGIGVKMNTQVIEWATFIERTRKHEFQASTAGWGTGVDPDTGWNLWRSDQYDPEGKFGRNYGGYSNPRVDELFELARHEFDRDKRQEYYQEIHRLIYLDQPYTFLFNRGTFWGLHERISGVTTSPRGIFNFTPAEMAWWVRAAAMGQ